MRNQILSILQAFLGHHSIIAIPAPLIRFAGSIESAAVLSQILYWGDRTKDPEGWFHKSYADWEAEISIPEHRLRKIARRMKEQGYLEIKFRKVAGTPKLHYRINQEVLSEKLIAFLRVEGDESSGSRLTNLQGRGLPSATLLEADESSGSRVMNHQPLLYTETTYIDHTKITHIYREGEKSRTSEPRPEVSNFPSPNQSISAHPKQAGWDTNSAPPAPPFEKNRRNTSEPWGHYSNPDPEFLSYLQCFYLPSLSCYQGRAVSIYQAEAWLIAARHDERRRDMALIQYKAFLEWKQPKNAAIVDDSAPEIVQQEFLPWLRLAIAAGITESFSTSDIAISGLPAGCLGVMRAGSERWEDWRAIAQEYPVERLQRLKAEREDPDSIACPLTSVS